MLSDAIVKYVKSCSKKKQLSADSTNKTGRYLALKAHSLDEPVRKTSWVIQDLRAVGETATPPPMAMAGESQ